MLKAISGVLMALMILFMAVNAMAQSAPSGAWWRSPRVIKALNLTDSETQRLESAFSRSRSKLVRLTNKVQREQRAFNKMMAQRNLNEAAVRNQSRKLERARSELANAKLDFVVEVRRIIGHTRFQKLVNMYPSR